MALREMVAGPALASEVEAVLLELARAVVKAPPAGRGRPPLLPAVVLWASLAIGIARSVRRQAEVWRLAMDRHRWGEERLPVSDEAVYRRLAADGASPLAGRYATLSALLRARIAPWIDGALLPWATEVVAIDETTLDPVARSLPALRDRPAGADALLPGKIAGVFDLRRQQWRAIELIDAPRQNEKVAARALVATLPAGSLILADLGYFGFAWFDDLTEAGMLCVSRLRAKTSHRTAHVFAAEGAIDDRLVWLGAHNADRAKHLLRLVRIRTDGTEHAYLTNVRSPIFLRPQQIAELYARRWGIELAVQAVKEHLGLALLWPAKRAVIHHQIWAVLLIAQIVQALRVEVAARAGRPVFDVSLELLLRHLPDYADASDPIAAFIADGEHLGYLRPSRRLVHTAPPYPMEQVVFPPPGLAATRTPRYAERKCTRTPALTNN